MEDKLKKRIQHRSVFRHHFSQFEWQTYLLFRLASTESIIVYTYRKIDAKSTSEKKNGNNNDKYIYISRVCNE